jgi:hypothetical protein
MKHLKFKAALSHNNHMVRLTLMRMTAVGSNFGNFSFDMHRPERAEGFKHNGLCIYSHGWYKEPHYDQSSNHEYDITHWLCLPASFSSPVATKQDIPIDKWPAVKAAIIAYNEWGATQP